MDMVAFFSDVLAYLIFVGDFFKAALKFQPIYGRTAIIWSTVVDIICDPFGALFQVLPIHATRKSRLLCWLRLKTGESLAPCEVSGMTTFGPAFDLASGEH